MAYNVKFTIPERALQHAPAEFIVERDGGIWGKLKLFKGKVVWVPTGKQKGYEMSWHVFDAKMQEHGKLQSIAP